jgi:formylmethanofuran dehydrogenase subunit E
MEEIIEKIKEFHGHLGPYVVIGYKMGLIANQKLGSDPFFKKAVVWTHEKPPMSCVIDGIQFSSGCTTGKASLLVEYGDIPKAKFTNKNGKEIQIMLKPKIKNEIEANVNGKNLESFAKDLFKRPDFELFEII